MASRTIVNNRCTTMYFIVVTLNSDRSLKLKKKKEYHVLIK